MPPEIQKFLSKGVDLHHAEGAVKVVSRRKKFDSDKASLSALRSLDKWIILTVWGLFMGRFWRIYGAVLRADGRIE